MRDSIITLTPTVARQWIESILYKIDNSDWGVVQLEERLTVTQEVVGSSPTAPACLLYSIYSLL